MEPQAIPQMKNSSKSEKARKRVKFLLVGILVIVLFLSGIYIYHYFNSRVSTDDAQIDGDIIPVLSRVSAYVHKVNVQENQKIQKGNLLIQLDSLPFYNQVEQQENALLKAKNNLLIQQLQKENTELAVKIAGERLKNAQAANWKAQNDFSRQEVLFDKNIITQDVFNETQLLRQRNKHNLELAQLNLKQAIKQAQIAKAAIEQSVLNIQAIRLKIESARDVLSYTHIYAPINAYVSQINLKPGQFVQVGQRLFECISQDSLWITAHFKETQIRFLKLGSIVDIEIDAYPKQIFKGYIASISPASESKYALLPPSNSSGNFVKIVQRFSLKIRFEADQKMPFLRAGMSVNVVYLKK